MLFSHWKRFVLAVIFAASAVALSPRASADVIYSFCSAGCNAGNSAGLQSDPLAAGLTFTSNAAIASTNMNSGVYTDPSTGLIVTMTAGGTDTNATANGALVNGNGGGTGTGYQITGFGTNASSFGMSVTMPAGTSQLQVTVNGTTYFLLGGGNNFFGIDSTTPITSVSVAEIGGSGFQLNGFEDGTAGGGATPELSTFLLMGTGLIGIGCRKRRANKPMQVPTQTV